MRMAAALVVEPIMIASRSAFVLKGDVPLDCVPFPVDDELPNAVTTIFGKSVAAWLFKLEHAL